MKEEARLWTGEEHMVKGNATVKERLRCRDKVYIRWDVYTCQHTDTVGAKVGEEGCEISATPVQTRNAVSTADESVLSQLKAQVLSLGHQSWILTTSY